MSKKTKNIASMPRKKKLKTDEAEYKCNACGKIVIRKLGWKNWTPSFCEESGKNARLYRVSAPGC